jgi:hypothetical protein
MSLVHSIAFSDGLINTLRTGDADLRLYAYKQFKYLVPNVLKSNEQERMWEEMVIARFEALPQYFPEATKENHEPSQ